MSNELIVIEQTNAVAILSTDDGISALLSNVRANIDSMGGGSMKNKTSRAKIRSNAFQATKAFKDINEKQIEPLIAGLTEKIQPQLDVINAVKANQSVLQSGLQKIRKDVNAEVDAFEAELQRVEDEKIEAERVAAVDRDYDFAKVLYNEYLSQVLLGESILADREKAILEKEEADRIAREKLIAEEAAAAAKLKAEQEAAAEKQRLIDEKAAAVVEAENQRKAAIQAEIDAEQAKQAAIEATALLEKQTAEAEVKRIAQEKEAKRLAVEAEQRRAKDKADAEALAEQNRLAAIEQTKIDEAKKIADKKLADDQAAATRKANTEHVTKIKTAIKLSFMNHAGLSEHDAINATKALFSGKIEHSAVKI